ncbi:MAG: hypothetical protein DIZ78_01065 [endosymbiont of Escarpia spicata]|uniref:Uncharacterized protein n=1 Tax=endosymbiont of Escarpia spicata TaxID=2200908 RepID=A0A370DTL8_9GAMM|nr:MAG: hypothetical protein DIZ78_01065 [endosymbiont of Escarpia spicata]
MQFAGWAGLMRDSAGLSLEIQPFCKTAFFQWFEQAYEAACLPWFLGDHYDRCGGVKLLLLPCQSYPFFMVEIDDDGVCCLLFHQLKSILAGFVEK